MNEGRYLNLEQEKIIEIIKRSNQFVVISGPSGSGKTMVIKHLVKNYGFIEPPFLTTRELRPGEQEIGGANLSKDDFTKREAGKKIFLPAHNYGNAYGYDLDVIFNITVKGNNVVVEVPASTLASDISNFLPHGTVIGMLPVSNKDLKAQLIQRSLNNDQDIQIRLQNSEIEKEQIIQASVLISITQIIPTHEVPENTISQVDRLMDLKGFKIKNSLHGNL